MVVRVLSRYHKITVKIQTTPWRFLRFASAFPKVKKMDIDIDTAAAEAVKALLPAKSEKIYEKQYKHFLDWCQVKDVADVTQEKVLLAYFFHHAKNLKASTVWSHYSMIKSKLIVEKSLDIGKYSKLKAFLKRNGDGYRPKKSRILDMDHIQQFLQEAPNQEYLMIKVK